MLDITRTTIVQLDPTHSSTLTMQSITVLALIAIAIRLTHAAVHEIVVGPGPTDPNFTPNVVTAQPGDVLSYSFGEGHDVSQGRFDKPCQPIENGIWSGNPSNGSVFNVTVNSTESLWIYCSVPGHCQLGMAMVVNPK
jgi:plastocyanin